MTATSVEEHRVDMLPAAEDEDSESLLAELATDPDVSDQAVTRVNKSEFLARVAVRSQRHPRVVTEVYDAMLAEITESANRDETIVLTKFGRFYRQSHKGHKVRFGRSRVDDYSVLKFSAAPGLNRQLGQDLSSDLETTY